MPRSLAAWKAGPSTKKIMPNVLGVSSPKGMAVMVLRPVCRASRNASQKNSRSPTSTPMAVPGIMLRRATSVGNAKTAVQQADGQEQIGDVI